MEPLMEIPLLEIWTMTVPRPRYGIPGVEMKHRLLFPTEGPIEIPKDLAGKAMEHPEEDEALS